MKIKTAQYIAKKQNGSYAVSAYRYKETVDDRSFQKGDLYCLLSLESEEDIQASILSKFVWDGILDAYLYSEAKTPNEAIMESLKMGERKVRDLIKNDKELEESGVNLNFALIANKKDGFYIGIYGDMEAFVYRQGNFVCISEVLKKNSAKTAGISLEKDEQLAVSTPELFSAFVESFDNAAGVDAIENSLKGIEHSLEGLEGILTLRVDEEVKVSFGNIKEEENIGEESIPIESEVVKKRDIVEEKGSKISLGGKENIFFAKVKIVITNILAFFLNIFKKIKSFCEPKYTKFKEKIGIRFGKNRVFKKVGSKISEIRFKQGRNRKGLFRVDGYREENVKKKRITLVIGVFLTIIAVSFLVRFIVNKKHQSEIHEIVTQQMNQAEGYLESASNNIVKDKEEAETSLYLADELLSALSEEISEDDSKRRDELLSEYFELEDKLLSRVGVSEGDSSLTKFFDTKIAFGDGSSPTDILYYTDKSENEYLYVSDEGIGGVYRVSIFDKEDIRGVPNSNNIMSSPQHIDYGYEGLYIYDSTKGVLRSPFSDNFHSEVEELTGVKSRDIGDSTISEIAILTQTDNIYLLSNEDGAILKSSRVGSGYGLTYAYIESDTFSNATEFFSDLTIYVLRPGSDGLETYIYDYLELKYKESPSKPTGLRNDFENLSKGYTRGSLDYNLYVFDSKQKRFVKFEKPTIERHPGELVLKGQYVYRGEKEGVFSDVKDFVVDKNEKYMYVLDGRTVWRMSL